MDGSLREPRAAGERLRGAPEVLREDYVRTAWAKGLGERIIVYKHALKNALIPVITLIGDSSARSWPARSSSRRSSRCPGWAG
jgi:hypothetical protein